MAGRGELAKHGTDRGSDDDMMMRLLEREQQTRRQPQATGGSSQVSLPCLFTILVLNSNSNIGSKVVVVVVAVGCWLRQQCGRSGWPVK